MDLKIKYIYIERRSDLKKNIINDRWGDDFIDQHLDIMDLMRLFKGKS